MNVTDIDHGTDEASNTSAMESKLLRRAEQIVATHDPELLASTLGEPSWFDDRDSSPTTNNRDVGRPPGTPSFLSTLQKDDSSEVSEFEMLPWEDVTSQLQPGHRPSSTKFALHSTREGRFLNLPSLYDGLRRLFALATSRNRLKPAYDQVSTFVARSGRGRKSYMVTTTPSLRSPTSAGKLAGWRGGLRLARIVTGTILAANIVFTITAVVISRRFNFGTISSDACEATHRTNSIFHFIINVLGTLLLASSNYTMQFLCAPSREQVDRTHRTGHWLTIGILNPRNIRSRKKAVLFGLLVLSSFPVHFLWNSAVFLTDKHVSSSFSVFIVTNDFLGETIVNCSSRVLLEPGYFNASSDSTVTPTLSLTNFAICPRIQSLLDEYHEQQLIKMDKTACQQNYKQNLDGPDSPLWETDVLTVTESTWNRTILGWFEPENNAWTCNQNLPPCDPAGLSVNATWLLGFERIPIDYCLVSEPLKSSCQVQFSALVMLAVIICNAIKFCCVITAIHTEHEEPLATIGDALASFLEQPDSATEKQCLLDRKMVLNGRRREAEFMRWRKSYKPQRWSEVPSKFRWWLTLVITVAIIAILAWPIAILGEAVTVFSETDPYSIDLIGTPPVLLKLYPWSDDNANVSMSAADFTSTSKYMQMVSVVNVPQLVLSSLYFLFNGIFTSIACALEWSRFSTTRKSLRTTEPRGTQRSTYWLSLPWKWTIPIAVFSILSHFFASETLFMVRIIGMDRDGNFLPLSSVLDVGWSTNVVGVCLAIACLIFVITVGLGIRRLPKGSLLVGNNSLAISAACHPPEDDVDAAFLPVMWGAVSHENEDMPGHCCLTSHEIEAPKDEGWYQ